MFATNNRYSKMDSYTAVSTLSDVSYMAEFETNGSLWNMTNLTDSGVHPRSNSALHMAAEIIIGCALVLIMFSIGCTIEILKLIQHVKRPIGPAVGMACQFVFLPLSMFGLAHALQLSPEYAIGLMVMAATPGGALSNMFTYWADGDVPLR